MLSARPSAGYYIDQIAFSCTKALQDKEFYYASLAEADPKVREV